MLRDRKSGVPGVGVYVRSVEEVSLGPGVCAAHEQGGEGGAVMGLVV